MKNSKDIIHFICGYRFVKHETHVVQLGAQWTKKRELFHLNCSILGVCVE